MGLLNWFIVRGIVFKKVFNSYPNQNNASIVTLLTKQLREPWCSNVGN